MRNNSLSFVSVCLCVRSEKRQLRPPSNGLIAFTNYPKKSVFRISWLNKALLIKKTLTYFVYFWTPRRLKKIRVIGLDPDSPGPFYWFKKIIEKFRDDWFS
jgi:hypothetical protein